MLVFSLPPVIVEPRPLAKPFVPPPMLAKAPVTVLFTPPETEEIYPDAKFMRTPLTDE